MAKTKKVWLKYDPAVTAEVLREKDGAIAAELHNPHAEDGMPTSYLGIINPDDWSEIELVPSPDCVMPRLFIAVIGEEDPESVTYVTFDNEVALRIAAATRDDILGYFEIVTPPAMIPV